MKLDPSTIPASATGYKLRMISLNWWFVLVNDSFKDVGNIGPMRWAEVAGVKAELDAIPLIEVERGVK